MDFCIQCPYCLVMSVMRCVVTLAGVTVACECCNCGQQVTGVVSVNIE